MEKHIKRLFNLFLIGVFLFTAFMTNVTPAFAATTNTITFNSRGGSPVAAITQTPGTLVNGPADPTKSGYSFSGWYSDLGLTHVFTFPATMPASDTTLYANWALLVYFIGFMCNGGTPVAMITQVPGTTVTAPAEPTRTGYTFGGWYSDPSFNTPFNFPTAMPAYGLYVWAKWTANSETITFNSNGGTPVSSITQDYDSQLTAPAAPTRTGYTFGGWYSDTGLTQPFALNTMPLSLTLYAKWNINSYTITLDNSWIITTITQPYGTTVNAPADPTMTGYTFSGWYSDAGLTQTFTFPTTMPAYSFTVYAKWTANSYSITFNSGGGSPVTDITQVYGTPLSAPANPTLDNFTFAGWFSDATLTTPYTFSTMPLSLTLYAKWTANIYSIVFNSGAGSPVPTITQPYGTPLSAPANPTKTGYTFGGWYSDASLTTPYTFSTMPLSLTLYAKWNINSYIITFNTGIGSPVPSVTQAYGSSLSAPADPTATGYTFAGWYSDTGLSTPYAFSTMPLSLTLYAKWTANSYTITFNTGSGSPVPSITQAYGTPLSAPVNPTLSGYNFVGWFSDAGLTVPYTFSTMPLSLTLYARWTATVYTMTFSSNGGSTISPITVVPGAASSAPADPIRIGYTFGGWYSDAGLTAAYSFTTMPAANITLYAKWTANNYTITLNNSGTVTAITQPYGTTVTAPANPTKTGYTFGGWYSDAGLTAAYSFTTMPAANITLYAKWTANNYTITLNNSGTVTAITQPYGTTVTAPANPTKTGYTFGGWYSDAGLTAAYSFTTMPAANVTLYAKWTANNYTITLNNSGTVTTITQPYGTTVTAPANPTKTGYTFGGWYSDAGLTAAYSFTTMPAANVTLYAKWAANVTSYNLTYAAGAHGTVKGAVAQTVNSGASGTNITAIPDVGYHFVKWSDGSLANPRVENNVRANVSVVATFAGPKATKQDVLAGLNTLRATVTNKQDGDKLDNAIQHLTNSLAANLWIDDAHLQSKGGDKAFSEEKDAVNQLAVLINDKKCTIPDAVLQGFINAIVQDDRQLAQIAIAADGDHQDIDKANAELTQGDSDVAKGNYDSGIEHYKNAWMQVTQGNNNQPGGDNHS